MSKKVDTSPAAIERRLTPAREMEIRTLPPDLVQMQANEIRLDLLAELTATRAERNAAPPELKLAAAIIDKYKADLAAAHDREEQLQKALEAVWHEFDQIYDGPESRIPGSLVEVISKAHAILTATPPSRNEMLEKRIEELTNGITDVRKLIRRYMNGRAYLQGAGGLEAVLFDIDKELNRLAAVEEEG